MPLTDVVELKRAEGPSKIDRYARQRQVLFLANTAPGVGSGEVGAALEKIVKEMNLPSQYRFVAFGQSREIARTGKAFIIAFGMSFIFMYLILAAQFESWLHPITILLALPLTVPFALVSLLMLRSVARHLHDARHPGPVRRREEELDPPDRPHQPAARRGATRGATRSCTATATGCAPS